MAVGLPGKPTPFSNAQQRMQEEAMRKLMAERRALADKLGHYPSDEELMKARKKIGR